MLIAVLTDIHGNREALEACLVDAARKGAERHVFLGDYVGYGADPRFVIDIVRSHVEGGAVALKGNHDDAVISGAIGMNRLAATAVAWTRAQLDEDRLRFLEERPLSAEDGDYLYVHANAWAPAGWGYILGATDAERSLRRSPARVTLCGHVHVPALYRRPADKPAIGVIPSAGIAMPLDRRQRWLAVIGAVGQPRDGDPDAAYALLDPDQSVLSFERVAYDVRRAARKIVDAGLPPRLASRLFEGN